MPSFGDLRGILKANGASTGTSNSLTGSVAVSIKDLVFVTFCEQTSLTATACADNLGNVYLATNAGNATGLSSGRSFYSGVTVAGTLTSVTVTATSSNHDFAGVAAVFTGPFRSGPVDKNPANVTTDNTSPFTGPSTGTLTTPDQLVVGWLTAPSSQTFAAVSPFVMADQANNSINAKACVSYRRVVVTTALTPSFTAGLNPNDTCIGATSFAMDTTFFGINLNSSVLGGESLIRPPHQIMGY